MSETEKKYYLAYGSNMSLKQMKKRTPDAKVIGKAILKDWQLCFKKHATIEPKEGKITPVLIWEISERDEKELDFYEGYPFYYDKQYIEVEVYPLEGGEPVTVNAMVYIMEKGHCLASPARTYYRGIEKAYLEFNLPIHILEEAFAESAGMSVKMFREIKKISNKH